MDAELALAVPGGSVRLVLARHGQTKSNVRHVLDTLPPGPGLTPAGKEQARLLAKRLADEKPEVVYASRALRAQETASPVAARHGLEVTVVDGIHEIHVGDLEGSGDTTARRRFEAVYTRWHAGHLDEPMPGGETGRQALTRFLAATREALDGVLAGAVVMVSHGALLRLSAAHLASNVGGTEANSTYLPNTGMIILEPAPGTATGWRCVRWDGLRPM